jgi:uncharacterized membrane protein YdjX (TVP38/TMEM64 family)
MFPAMLPPPTPFKAFVLASAVAEMSISHFVLAIFLGRLVRFFALALFVIKFGPGALNAIRIFFSHHFHWLLLIAAAVLIVWLVLKKRKRRGSAERIPPSS